MLIGRPATQGKQPEAGSIDVIRQHIPRGLRYGLNAIDSLHQRYLALLFMTNGVRHDPQPRIAGVMPFLIRHFHGAA